MNLERHVPRPPLADFVDYLWHVSDAPSHAQERILPNGTLELVFNLVDDEIRIYDGEAAGPCRKFAGAVVSGVFSRFFVIDARQHACMLGAHFKPGGAFPFLRRLPARELANSHLELSALWGRKAGLLRERLAAAATVQERFHRLEAALLGELGSPAQSHRAIPPTLHALGSSHMSISELSARVNLSHRRLIELFTLEVGATPKLLQRVQRFQRALALARSRAEDTPTEGAVDAVSGGADVAQLAGYCDQSHWIRDCVAFAGLTPAQYSTQWTSRVKADHVPLVRGLVDSARSVG